MWLGELTRSVVTPSEHAFEYQPAILVGRAACEVPDVPAYVVRPGTTFPLFLAANEADECMLLEFSNGPGEKTRSDKEEEIRHDDEKDSESCVIPDTVRRSNGST